MLCYYLTAIVDGNETLKGETKKKKIIFVLIAFPVKTAFIVFAVIVR